MPAPTHVSTTTPQTGAAATLAVNMPSMVGANDNDLILVWMGLSGIMSTMPGSPHAFTLKLTGDSNQVWAYLRVWQHVANGSPSSYTFTTSGGTITRAMASRISGALATGDPFHGTPSVGTTSLSLNSASLTMNTTIPDTLLVNYDTKSSSSTNTGVPTGLTLQTPATSAAHLFTGVQAAPASPTSAKQSSYGTTTNHRSVLAAIAPVTTQTVAPSGIASTSAVGTPTVTPGSVTISPDGVGPTSDVGTPTLTPGEVTISPSGVAPESDVGTPTVSPGAVTISPDGVGPTSDVGTPTVLLGQFIRPDGIGPTSAVGVPTVLTQPVVAGVVRDHETGLPVGAGVEVKLFDDNDLLVDTTITDAGGVFVFTRPIGDTDLYWTLATFEIAGVQYHGVSDRGCPAT